MSRQRQVFVSASCRSRSESGGLRSRPSQLKGLANNLENSPRHESSLPKIVCAAALQDHHIKNHSHFTNCTRHVDTKGPQKTPPVVLLLPVCHNLDIRGKVREQGKQRGPAKVYIRILEAKDLKRTWMVCYFCA